MVVVQWTSRRNRHFYKSSRRERPKGLVCLQFFSMRLSKRHVQRWRTIQASQERHCESTGHWEGEKGSDDKIMPLTMAFGLGILLGILRNEMAIIIFGLDSREDQTAHSSIEVGFLGKCCPTSFCSAFLLIHWSLRLTTSAM